MSNTMTTLWPEWLAQGGTIHYISAPPLPAWCEAVPRTVALLGSTGSIGVSALKVMAAHPALFQVVALAGARNIRLLAEQAAYFRPAYLGVFNAQGADALRALLPRGYTPRIVIGQEGYTELAMLAEVSTVLSAQVGAAGLRATVAAASAGKVICLANKESMVLAGELIRYLCLQTGACILPVDSEHNAIFQALAGRPASHVRRVILTASGGPFCGFTRDALYSVTREQALKHPNWNMGTKITIDSATLMNKGLEVMEAFHLYGLKEDAIDVVIHPQSLVHSLVEFKDASLMAHMGSPDMRMAIAHCMGWPHCLNCKATGVAPLDIVRAGTLTFMTPDVDCFPALALARRALRERGGQSVVLNAANEVAVALFLAGHIGFMDIPALCAQAMEAHAATQPGHSPLCFPLPEDTRTDSVMVAAALQRIQDVDNTTRRQVYAWVGIQE